MKKIIVLSLFDGMSCGQQALERIGLKPEKYLSSEIDTHAMNVTRFNYPDTIFVGSVNNPMAKARGLFTFISFY